MESPAPRPVGLKALKLLPSYHARGKGELDVSVSDCGGTAVTEEDANWAGVRLRQNQRGQQAGIENCLFYGILVSRRISARSSN